MQKFWKRQRGTSTEQGESVALANTQPFSSTKENYSNESIKTPAPAAQTVTYESVPIPQGYSTPLGPVHAPATPGARSFRAVDPPASAFAHESTTPRFGTGNRNSYMGSSPLANSESYGFTPLRREPMTPKTPGTFMGDPKTPLSPTFREEQLLEKHEQKVEKLDQKDLVSRFTLIRKIIPLLTTSPALEDPCPYGKSRPSMSQLRLLSRRPLSRCINFGHFPRY
jgi:hypothetical protein